VRKAAYAMSHLSAVNQACTHGLAGCRPTRCRAWHGYISLQQQRIAATYTMAENWMDLLRGSSSEAASILLVTMLIRNCNTGVK